MNFVTLLINVLVLDSTYTRDRDCYVVKRDLDWPVAPETRGEVKYEPVPHPPMRGIG